MSPPVRVTGAARAETMFRVDGASKTYAAELHVEACGGSAAAAELPPGELVEAALRARDDLGVGDPPGDLGELRSAGGHYQFLTQAQCFANDFAGTSISTGSNPAPGNGRFWVMRAVGWRPLIPWERPRLAQRSRRGIEGLWRAARR